MKTSSFGFIHAHAMHLTDVKEHLEKIPKNILSITIKIISIPSPGSIVHIHKNGEHWL